MPLIETTARMTGVIAIIAIAAYLALCGLLFALQRSMIYYPQPSVIQTATIKLPAKDTDVRVSVRPRPGRKAIVYFGGNAEDVSINLPSFAQAFPSHAIYLLHYRGYGGSGGKPSEAAIQDDALALFDLVFAEHPEITVIGRSLGSGVAVRLASLRPASRLVLVTPYHSIEAIAASQFPYIPVKWLLLDKYDSWRYAPLIAAPTLVLAAEHDEVIPRTSTEQLVAHFKAGIAAYLILPGTGHNTISESPRYLAAIKDIL